MVKRGRRRPGNPAGSEFGSARNDVAVTLREEKTGKRDQSSNQKRNKNINNKAVSVKASDMSRIEHLEFCAVWAARDAKIPSLAAHYGQRLAVVRESLGLAPNPALLQCQRCETIIWRDINCTVRPKKNKAKTRQISSEKHCAPSPNYVVYTCHFCSYKNLKKENPRRRTKETCPSNTVSTLQSKPTDSDSQKPVDAEEVVEGRDEASARPELSLSQIPAVSSEIPTTDGPTVHIFASDDVEMTSNPTPSESNPPKPIGLEKVVEGRDKDNTMHEPALPLIIGGVKEICLSGVVMTPNPVSLGSNSLKPVGLDEVNDNKNEVNLTDKSDEPPAPFQSIKIEVADGPTMPTSRTRLTLLDTNKRKRKKSTAKKPVGPENSSAPKDEQKTIGKSSKWKRKSWIGLKEIVDSNEQAKKRSFYNSPIPFSL